MIDVEIPDPSPELEGCSPVLQPTDRALCLITHNFLNWKGVYLLCNRLLCAIDLCFNSSGASYIILLITTIVFVSRK